MRPRARSNLRPVTNTPGSVELMVPLSIPTFAARGREAPITYYDANSKQNDMSVSPKILIVDDRPENLLALETQLRGQPAEVLEASNGDEALELLLKHEVALALIDVQLPEMDGFELAEIMRGSPRTREIPIILVTAGLHDQSRIFKGYDAGAVDFLIKPIESRVLVGKVAVFLQLYRQKRELGLRVCELERALTERRSAEAQLAADHAALLQLHELNARLLRQEDLAELLDATVGAAVALTGASKGTLQLLDAETNALRIVAQHGFGPAFIEHFSLVQDGPAVCGEAMRRRARVVVENVSTSTMFRGTTAGAILEAEQVVAVQSTVLLSRQGKLLGVISTHWATPPALSENTFRMLDLLARQVADLIEYRQREESLAEMNAQLIEESRRKNAFLATLSHELRNPLAPITNSLHILERSGASGAQASRARAIITRQVSQLASLINDLLDVTRVTSNKINLQRVCLELNELVVRTVEDTRSLFEQSGVQLEVETAPDSVFVHADSTRLAQVISNLLQNAAKFTARGGTTRVVVSTNDAEAAVRVIDSGMGMTRETLDGLFQPFMQAEQTLARSRGGLGLGLALVKGLVELHGGKVEARSEGLGKGAEFTILLPLQLDTSAEIPSTAVCSGSQPRRRILIIEDNVDAAESLREVLELCEHQVEVAHDGPEGLAKAHTFRPEIVLCDIGLPGMDGFEVAKGFRANHDLGAIRLVALSGYALPEDIQRAVEAGFDQHLAKPPSLQKLEKLFTDLG